VAVRAARASATTFWENRLLDIAQGGPGNAQAIQWALRNRSGPEGGPLSEEPRQQLDISALSWEQRDQLEAILLAAAAHGAKANSKE
jgi:hypothetical protein